MTSHSKTQPTAPRLLSKREVLDITGVSYPTIWQMMCRGEFPRSRIVGAQSRWLSTEVDAWLAGLPIRRLKGDAPEMAEQAEVTA